MSQPLIVSFRPDAAAMCLDGRKTMTRRKFSPDMCWAKDGDRGIGPVRCADIIAMRDGIFIGRMIWGVKDTIAIKPTRVSKAEGRVECVNLCVERLHEIDHYGALCEGFDGVPSFLETWRKLYPSGDYSVDANPLVVVISFQPVVTP